MRYISVELQYRVTVKKINKKVFPLIYRVTKKSIDSKLGFPDLDRKKYNMNDSAV